MWTWGFPSLTGETDARKDPNEWRPYVELWAGVSDQFFHSADFPARSEVSTPETYSPTVGMSRAVTVTGDGLTFTLNDGGIVVYDAAATAALGDPTKMVFSYTVGATDLPVSGLSFVRGDQNGSVIVDGMGRGPDFSGIFAVLFSGIQVGPVAPAVLTAGPELQAASVNGAAVAELTGGNFAIAWLDGSTVHGWPPVRIALIRHAAVLSTGVNPTDGLRFSGDAARYAEGGAHP